MTRTPEHCGLITRMGDKDSSYPRRENGKCQGYAAGIDNDEPCDICKECKYNEFYED